jgi:hypothetical protein
MTTTTSAIIQWLTGLSAVPLTHLCDPLSLSTRFSTADSTQGRFLGGRRGDVLRFTVSGSLSDRVAGSES